MMIMSSVLHFRSIVKNSNQQRPKNGVFPQGLVIASLYFNVYVHDLLPTNSVYAADVVMVRFTQQQPIGNDSKPVHCNYVNIELNSLQQRQQNLTLELKRCQT